MRRILKFILIALLYLNIGVNGQSVVCRREHIEGFDKEYQTGSSVCGDNTNQLDNSFKIYLTIQNNYTGSSSLYAQSNFLSSGAENPTKIATSENIGLYDLVYNIVGPDDAPHNLDEVIYNKINFIVDGSHLDGTSIKGIDLSRIKNLSIICPDGRARKARALLLKGDAKFIIEDAPFLFVKFDENFTKLIDKIKEYRIKREETKLISLIDNSTTDNIINNKFKDVNVLYDPKDGFEKLKNILLENRAKRIILLCHTEGDNIVALSKNNKEHFKASIIDVENFIAENKLSVLILGCNSGEKGAASGVLNKFNSAEVLNNLEEAFKADNTESFFETLAGDKYAFVVNDGFIRSDGETIERFEVEVYRRKDFEAGNLKKPLGRLLYSNRQVSNLFVSSQEGVEMSNDTFATDTMYLPSSDALLSEDTPINLEKNNEWSPLTIFMFISLLAGVVFFLLNINKGKS